MTASDDGFKIRPGRIRQTKALTRRPRSFAGEVMMAAKRAGHVGKRLGPRAARGGGSRFGRGRRAAISIKLPTNARRVTVKARVVRHGGTRFRGAPLSKHMTYLKRDGITRDGKTGQLFDADKEVADERAFAARCKDDRHHFRFIVSPEDATAIGDLKTFTRELAHDMEADLGTKLDWVAVDHWDTDNPHVHLLVRGRTDDGEDLVISRDYISRGLRDRASERVTLELGPRSELEVRTALEREVDAERWTSLDSKLRDLADDNGGVLDLRPGDGADPDRGLLLGRAAKLQRLGLAEPVGPACWTLKPSCEDALRDLSVRGDIIKTMHRAMSREIAEPDVSAFTLHGDQPSDPVLGRLVERGLDDELNGAAYVVVAGVDGRTHHVRFNDLEMTGDAKTGAVVEVRTYEDDAGHHRMTLATRSDLTLQEQVRANGATWLDRQLLSKPPEISEGGFGAEVREAMRRREAHLVAEGLARRQGLKIVFARDLLSTLRQRDLDGAIAKLEVETGLANRPAAAGDEVAGVFRRRLTLASGRFAMIEDGLGFQLVPWRPALEQRLGQHVAGTMTPGGGIDWNETRQRGLAR